MKTDTWTINPKLWIRNPLTLSLLVVIIQYGTILFMMDSVLKFDALRSDVLSYWEDSLAWQTPFNVYHVPFYPLLIAFLRGISFEIFAPITLMRTLNFSALLINTVLTYRILSLSKLHPSFAAFGSILFNSWPFLGITYAVYPVADTLVFTFFLGGLYFLLSSRYALTGLLFGVAMVTHKGVWPFIFSLIGMDLLLARFQGFRKWFVPTLIMVFPLVTLWLAGSMYNQDYLWMFPEFSSETFFEGTRTGSGLFSALIQSFQPDQLKDIGKGLAVIGSFALALVGVYLSIRFREKYWGYGLVISLVCLLFLAIFSYREGWYIVRFSRLLVFPLFWSLPALGSLFINSMKKRELIFASLIWVGLFASQIIFTWYLPSYFAR